jgi:hypothetical protein
MWRISANSLLIASLGWFLTGCRESNQPVLGDGALPRYLLTNQPPPESVIRYTVARPMNPLGYHLPREDGEYILGVTKTLHELSGDRPLLNQFGLVADIGGGEGFALTFTTNAQSVYFYPNGPSLRVPADAATQIVQRVEQAMRRN